MFETLGTVRANSYWSAARDGTSSKESGAHLGDKNSCASASDGWWQEDLEKAKSWMELGGNMVMEAAEDYLENCACVKVDIEVLERLMKPENREIPPRYTLKYSTRGGSNIFQLFETAEKHDHRGSQKKMVGESLEKRSTARELAKRMA